MVEEKISKQQGTEYFERRDFLRTAVGTGIALGAGVVSSAPVSASGGDIVWEFDADGYVSSSPTVVDGTVFARSDAGSLYAVDRTSGEQEWAFDVGESFLSSPTVVDRTAFVGSLNNTVYAVTVDSGQQEWTFETAGDIRSSPTVVDGTVFVGSADNSLYAIDATTGEQEWLFQASDSVTSSPTVVDGTLFVGSFDQTVYALDAATGEQEWEFDTNDIVTASPTVADGTVFVGSYDNTLYALDAATGEQEWTLEADGSLASSPTVANGTVYVGSEDNSLYAVDTASGEQKWTFETDNWVFSSATVVDGTVFVGSDDGSLYALRADNGKQEWTFEMNGQVISSPLVSDGTLFVGGPETLYALDAGVSGSSEGSRVMLGSLGHHDEWRYAGQTLWTPNITVDSIKTTAPVQEGESIEVTAKISNTGRRSGTETAKFELAGIGTESVPVSLESGESVTETVTFDTAPGDAGEHQLNVSTADSATSVSVTVRGQPSFAVAVTGLDDSIPAGDTLDFDVEITNTGGTQGTGTVDIELDGIGSKSVEVTLAGGESTTESLSFDTATAEVGEYSLTVDSGDDSVSETVSLLEPPSFDVSILSSDTATAPEKLSVEVQITNTGDVGGTGTVKIELEGVRTKSIDVSLESGQSVTETISFETPPGATGEYRVTVTSDDDSGSETVPITEASSEGTASENGSAAGDTADETTDDSDTGGSIGAEVMALVGGGAVTLVGGGYLLLRRRSDEESADESETDSAEATDATSNAETDETADTGAEKPPAERFKTNLQQAREHLQTARQHRTDGKYDRGLDAAQAAVDAATAAKDIADSSFEDQVSDTRAMLETATTLATDIEAEREAYDSLSNRLDVVANRLDTASQKLDAGEYAATFDHIEDIRETLHDVRVTAAEYGFEDVARLIDQLESRCDQLENRTQQARPIPRTIPTLPRLSLSYDDIEKGDQLGSGDNTAVYYATATVEDEQNECALKEFGGDGTLHADTVDRVLEGANTWQELDDHDHVVSIADYGTEPVPWIAMEYMDGGHLGQRGTDMAFEQALWTAIVTTKAVRHAHRRGVAHLDLKPSNILFRSVEDAWDVPKVSDWGLSKHALTDAESNENIAVEYAAPEQFDDNHGATDDITDIYQLGAVFYELFTGQPPFEGDPSQVRDNHVTARPARPSEIADVPAQLDEMLLTALATEKDDRYETVVQLRNELQELWEQI